MPELTWQGKYDANGRRVIGACAPFSLRTVESAGAPPGPVGWSNRLIQGAAEHVLPALLPEFAGQVQLAYMDPPFSTGSAFALSPALGVPSDLPRIAYRDDSDLDTYLQWFSTTALLLRDLLAEDGALIVHCDWRANSAIRLVLDDVFGPGNLRNEIIWAYRSGGASRRESLARKHDTLLLYARSPRFRIRPLTERQYLRKPFMGSKQDAHGRYYVDTLLRDILEGELTCVEDDAIVRYNVRPVLNLSRERLDYPTQKPLGLLKLLCRIATDPGDLVLDCCCGSGTTAQAAEELGRRWIAADAGSFAVQTVRKRLLALPAPAPSLVQRLDQHPTGASPEQCGEATAEISIEATVEGRAVSLALRGYTPPGGSAGDAVRWCDLIDSWAIDWDGAAVVFRVGSFSTRSLRKPEALVLTFTHTYDAPGHYRIACRVVDVFAHETTHLLDVAIE